MPPLSQADLDAIARIVDKRIDAKVAEIEKRVDRHSDGVRDLVPAVRREFSESKHDGDSRNMGFERYMKEALTGVRHDLAKRIDGVEHKVDTVVKSIPPAAMAAQGAEAAAVAGAQASLRSEVDQKKSLDAATAAKRWAQRSPAIVIIVQAIAYGVYQAILAAIHAH